MKGFANDKETNRNYADTEILRRLKHDINNQLSNIFLAIEQLRYEIPEASEDCSFYLESISMSASRINNLLKATE
jgi:nitrogen-specific signal transduction histidine kinase